MTFLLHGGLNQIIFRDRLRLWHGALCGGLNSSLYLYLLLYNASSYMVAASLNKASSDEISERNLLTISGIFIMLGGWFDLLCT